MSVNEEFQSTNEELIAGFLRKARKVCFSRQFDSPLKAPAKRWGFRVLDKLSLALPVPCRLHARHD
jgi:hypothetical protein